MSRKKFQHKPKNYRPDRPGFSAPVSAKTISVPVPSGEKETEPETSASVAQMMQMYQTIWSYPALEKRAKPPAVNLYKLGKLKEAEPRLVAQKRVPDMVTTIIAWRAWEVSSVDGNVALCGLGMSENWPAKQRMAANCKQRGLIFSVFGDSNGRKHAAPHDKCLCGIWAFRTLEELLAMLQPYEGVKVVGQVHLWGRVIECENGYRAQFAYPKELWLLDDSLEELGWVYGVPIRTATTERG